MFGHERSPLPRAPRGSGRKPPIPQEGCQLVLRFDLPQLTPPVFEDGPSGCGGGSPKRQHLPRGEEQRSNAPDGNACGVSQTEEDGAPMLSIGAQPRGRGPIL